MEHREALRASAAGTAEDLTKNRQATVETFTARIGGKYGSPVYGVIRYVTRSTGADREAVVSHRLQVGPLARWVESMIVSHTEVEV